MCIALVGHLVSPSAGLLLCWEVGEQDGAGGNVREREVAVMNARSMRAALFQLWSLAGQTIRNATSPLRRPVVGLVTVVVRPGDDACC